MSNFDDNGSLEAVSLGARVFKRIEEDIIGGKYAPGDVLVETKLSEALGVSRTPVREAMLQLELEGLIRTVPNKETVVVGFSRRDIEDIYTMRACIEGIAAKRAAAKATDAEIKKLGDIIALHEFYISRGDPEKLVMLDNQFHDTIYDATNSRILNHTLQNLHNQLKKARTESLRSPSRYVLVVEEHKKIYEAICARDEEAAEAAAITHINNARENFIKNMLNTYND